MGFRQKAKNVNLFAYALKTLSHETIDKNRVSIAKILFTSFRREFFFLLSLASLHHVKIYYM